MPARSSRSASRWSTALTTSASTTAARIWVGGSDLRNDAIDALLTNADLRRAVAALDEEQRAALRAPYGFAAVLDPEGRPLASFHDTTGRFPAVSSVLLHEDTVTFGTLNGRGLAQIPVPDDLA